MLSITSLDNISEESVGKLGRRGRTTALSQLHIQVLTPQGGSVRSFIATAPVRRGLIY
jgi:hypothetical protein